MRTWRILNTIILVFLLLGTPTTAELPQNGTFTSLDTGTEKSFDQLLGGYLIVEAFATWCTPCKEEMYELSFVEEQFGDNLTLLSLSVSPGTDNINKIAIFKADAESTHEFTASWEFGLDQDGVFQVELNIEIVPTTILFDNNGKVEKKWEGIVEATTIGGYLDNNVTFPERNRDDELINTLVKNPLFKISVIAILLAGLYRLLIPKPRQ